jgi:CheY-like chemotaxis protein/signal transduction histidine kinase
MTNSKISAQDQNLSDASLGSWRFTLARRMFQTIAIISLPAFLASAYYAYDEGTYAYIPIYIAMLAFMLVAAFWKSVPSTVHVWGMMGLIYFIVLLDFYTEGRGSLARSFLVVFSFMGAVFFQRRGAIISAAIGLLTMIAFAYLYVAEFLPDYQVGSTIASGWISNTVIVAVLMTLIVFSVSYLVREMEAFLSRSRQLNQDLELEHASLEQSINDRTAVAEAARAEADKAQSALRAQLDEINAIARISESMRGEQDLVTLSQTVLRELCGSLGAVMGAIFVREGSMLRMVGSYAYTRRKNIANAFYLGEGLIGQAALEKQPILITNAPRDYVSIAAGMVELAPRVIMAVPFMRDGNVIGVIELASLNEFTAGQTALLNKAIENIAIAFSTAQARAQINTLLEQTQLQAQELRVREEELKSINEELHAQAETLRASQERLRKQQKELESANAELEERAGILQQQRAVLDQQNKDLTEAQDELTRKAEELTIANKYKSEFLANMSHELRTPLNSLLILSRMFANNDDGNLTSDQIESAKIIFNSGTDLLNLINEILDLSKVEAGRMIFNFAPMELENLADNMRAVFAHVAEEKNLNFEITLADGLPASIESDQLRVEQIVKNLLSNAFKFTSEGAVKLRIEPAGNMVAIRVSDSGIGMTPEQQKLVFEAFQQADGSTSRKYGGTGLGLTISRELAAQMGGRIELRSELGKGSTFSLLLPLQREGGAVEAAPQVDSAPQADTQPRAESDAPRALSAKLPTARSGSASQSNSFVDDDRDQIKKGDKILLVIEDDASFAKIVMDYGRKQGFKCVAAGDGESGLQLAKAHKPDAVLLDLKLPGMSGWEVLDALKHDSALRHIPVHILSATEETMDAYKRGALGFLAKPVSQEGLDGVFHKIGEFLTRNIRTLLLVEDDAGLRYSVRQLLGGSDVKISEAESGSTAMELLRSQQFDCMILDLSLPDMTGFELLNRIHHDETVNKCPIIVYTGKALSGEENEQLLKYANSVIIKGVKSPERLLDETALFLHRVVADMSEEKQDTIRRLHDRNAVFNDKHVLVVDDDMRNAFALSRLLSDKGLKVSLARSGAKAIEMLEAENDIDLVLMDIMMPEMDGYETMQRIRAQQRFKNLPILALTAKAMKGDLEKCIEAGANDYLSKPVDAERLFSMLRVWLYR